MSTTYIVSFSWVVFSFQDLESWDVDPLRQVVPELNAFLVYSCKAS